MKILIICSKAFYKDIAPIKEKLEENGHVVELPNSYYEPDAEKRSWDLGEKAHSEFKARMFKMSEERIATMDAVLTLNFDKNGKKNYIGGATFIEIYEAFMKGKKIYLYNDIPEGMLYDEISGFSPIVIKGDINGEIKCNNEIKEAIWIDKNYKEKGIKVGSILGEHVIPKLIERGLM